MSCQKFLITIIEDRKKRQNKNERSSAVCGVEAPTLQSGHQKLLITITEEMEEGKHKKTKTKNEDTLFYNGVSCLRHPLRYIKDWGPLIMDAWPFVVPQS